MAQNIVKNQHYIPESLLRHFVNPNGKFFEALLINKKVYPTNPGDSMCEKFTYEDDGLRVNAVENYFNKIETEIAPLIKALIEAIDGYKSNESEFSAIKTAIENLLPTLIVFYYRSGALLTEFSSINPRDKIPLLSKKILNHKYINLLARVIKNCYKFAIIESDGDFLMSDQFISTAALGIKSQFANISNRHVGIKETMILIPISLNYYAVYWHTDNSFFIREESLNTLSEGEIKLINQAVINNSYRKCIGTKKENLDNVLTNYHLEFPSQVYIGHELGGSSGYIRKKEVFLDDIDKQAYNILSHHIHVIKGYMTAGRNDRCPCGSGKKFKKCHEHVYERIKIPIQNLANQENVDQDIYKIPGAAIVELPIDEWSTFAR